MWCLSVQLMDSKAAELERLLSQLSDVNDGMRNALGGRNDTRAHTLTRHRDILHDYQQVIHAQVLLRLLSCILPTQIQPDASMALSHLLCMTTQHAHHTDNKGSSCRSLGGTTAAWAHQGTGCSFCEAAPRRVPCWVVRVTMHQEHCCENGDKYQEQMQR